MCGIIGLVSNGGISKDTWKLFLTTFSKLEVRGDKASGIVIWLDDYRFFIVKQPVSSSQLAKKLERLQIPLSKVIMVLGHAREPTQGSPYINENNHPLYEIVDNRLIAIVHNGHIYAYSALEKKREVDSDYFLSFIRQKNAYNDDIILTTFKHVFGSYAVIFGDGKTMYIARNTNPLEQYATDDAVIFASDFYDIVKDAKPVEPYKIFKITTASLEPVEIAEMKTTYATYNYAYW